MAFHLVYFKRVDFLLDNFIVRNFDSLA